MKKWKLKETKYPEDIEQIHNYDLKELFENIIAQYENNPECEQSFIRNLDEMIRKSDETSEKK